MTRSKNTSQAWFQSFQGLDGLDAIGELGELGKISKQLVRQNGKAVKRILQDDETYKSTDVLPFDEVVKNYNQGISEDELKAWVWYQRGQGEKMIGWEKYFLNLGHESITSIHVKTAGELNGQRPILRDNHFREIMEVNFGELIGSFTGKKLEYDKELYLIVKTDERVRGGLPKNALVYILEKEVDAIKHESSINHPILDDYVKRGILFYMAGQLLPHPIYGYGNMYDRELQLAKDKDHILSHYGKEAYDRQHGLILNPVDKGGLRPRLLSVLNPDPTQRPKILSISKFAKEFTISSFREETNLEIDDEAISLFEAFKLWLKTVDPRDFQNVKLNEIVKYYLEGDNLSQRLTDDQKMGIEKYAMLEAEEFFVTFLNKALTFEDQQKIDFAWNRIYNGHSSIPFHKVPIGFSCSAMFKSGVLRFSQTQREAIAFMEIAKSGIIAYDVGVGKTMAAIITLANNLYSGKCLRPLIVVPNPTYGKWVKEIIGYTDPITKTFVPGVLSNVGYTVHEWYNLGKGYQEKIKLVKEVPAKTITVITYEGFAKLGFSKESFDDFFEEMSDILNQVDVSKLTQRDVEKRNQTYREMLGMGNKNTITDLDKMGFDYIVIDEAHNFKNVFDNVMAEDGIKRFKVQGSQSTRAIKAFFVCNYIQRTFGRNVMLLTATPFTNSPLEIYSMLSLVAYNYMKKNGLANVQRFMEAFVLQTLEYVNSYDDTIKEQHVVKSFNNRLVLQQLIFNHIAYKTGEEAGVKRPCKINLPRLYAKDEQGVLKKLERAAQSLTYLAMTQQQKENQEDIVAMARSSQPGDGNLMRALSYSLDNAVSPFLYKNSLLPEDYLEFVEESPKIKYVMECMRSVKQWHEERNEPVSGQVIYINRGKDFFKYIKEYLEKELGYKQKVKHHRDTLDEVEILTSGMTLERKETIKEAFLEGVCKVIIGTSTIREGIDLQRKGTVLYNCYPDWNPTDVKQLEGRIWRQGNEFGYVRVVMPLLQDSMDVFVFQKLEEKTARINDIWYRGGSSNVIDLESIDPEEVKFALFSNVDALAKIVLDKEQMEVRRKISVAEINVETLMEFDKTLQKYTKYREECFTDLRFLVDDYQSEYFSVSHDYKHHRWFVEMTPAEQKAFLEKVRLLLEETRQFFAAAVQEDKEIVRLGRQFARISEVTNGGRLESFSRFRGLVSEIRKAEESIMKEKGFTIHDNLMDVIQAYRAEKESLLANYEMLTSQGYSDKVYAEVREKKNKMNIRGESPEYRAREFATLNHLLSYRASDVIGDHCILPKMEIKTSRPTPNEGAQKELELLRLRARALALRLKLSNGFTYK